MSVPQAIRYGVFLNPDAATSAAVTMITGCVRAQYGLVSAGRFPPHITLAGSLPVRSEDELIAAVGEVSAAHDGFRVHHRGIGRLGESVVFDVHLDDSRQPNAALADLADDVRATVQPLLVEAAGVPADVRDRAEWRAHLSLASHELLVRDDLRSEVEDYIRELGVPCPKEFTARTITVYRLRHPTWTGTWWDDFSWEHLRTFPLGADQ